MKLLFVHGRSQGGKDPVALKAEWIEAFTEGLRKTGLQLPPGTQIEFPFYGDQLDEFVRRFDLPADPAFIPKGAEAFDEFAAFRREVADEMKSRAGISDDEVSRETGPLPAEKGLQNWAWVQSVVRLLDRNMTDVSQTTIEVFLRDVFLYTRRDVVRTAIDRIVAQAMGDDTAVIIGHSLGTVVAYNVMKAARSRVPRLVTLGSPLSIRAVRKTILPISNPAGAGGWHNAYDPTDIVSLYPLDAENFDVAPPISNFTVENWTDNRHSIAGYLSNGKVAKAIYAGLVSPGTDHAM